MWLQGDTPPPSPLKNHQKSKIIEIDREIEAYCYELFCLKTHYKFVDISPPPSPLPTTLAYRNGTATIIDLVFVIIQCLQSTLYNGMDRKIGYSEIVG